VTARLMGLRLLGGGLRTFDDGRVVSYLPTLVIGRLGPIAAKNKHA